MSRALSMIATGSRRTLATIGGLALGLGIFMLLPVLESITSTQAEELQVQDADTIAPHSPHSTASHVCHATVSRRL